MPWEPLPDQTSEPAPVSEPLGMIMSRLAGTSVSVIELVMAHWPEIVGDQVAAATNPIKIVDGCLTVRADDPVWATELRWLEPTVIERIGVLADGAQLAAVRVQVATAR